MTHHNRHHQSPHSHIGEVEGEPLTSWAGLAIRFLWQCLLKNKIPSLNQEFNAFAWCRRSLLLLVLGLLAGNCWPAPRRKQEGKQALRSPTQEQLRSRVSTAHHPFPLVSSSPFWRERVPPMRSRRGV